MKHKRKNLIFGLVLILAVISLGCGLTERLGSGQAENQGETEATPTRTPWPTFTPTAASVAGIPTEEAGQAAGPGDLPTQTPIPLPTDTPIPLPSDTPTTVPPTPTDTPVPATNTPAAPAAPTATPLPPATPKPQYQFTPGSWYGGDPNNAIVRFYGHIKDTAGVPVNGYCIRATCGSFAVLSFPSGPSIVAPDWAPGWYDQVIIPPVSCDFTLQVVEYQCNTPGYFDAQCDQFNPVSDAIHVSTDVAAGETIVVADWVKNW